MLIKLLSIWTEGLVRRLFDFIPFNKLLSRFDCSELFHGTVEILPLAAKQSYRRMRPIPHDLLKVAENADTALSLNLITDVVAAYFILALDHHDFMVHERNSLLFSKWCAVKFAFSTEGFDSASPTTASRAAMSSR